MLRVLRLLEAASAGFLFAFADSIAEFGNSAESASLTLNLQNLRASFLVEEELGALVAHAAENFVDKLDESTVIYWLGQLNVAKVTWTLFLRYNFDV